MSSERNLQSPKPERAEPLRRDTFEALARLGGGMAHDLNNVLHVIKNATELLRQRMRQADPDTSRLLDMLSRNADRGRDLTREMLAFSGRQPLEPVAVNVNRLIADMQHRLREALGRGPQIETVLLGNLWPVEADPAELETVILNLAENARDAMAGRGKVTIETANVTTGDTQALAQTVPAADYVSIAVRDTGSGMSDDTLARAFEPYFTTKQPGPMTGLGLSHVYGAVTQMGGHVTIDTAPGRGTTVTVYLPRLGDGLPGDSAQAGEPPKVVHLAGKTTRAAGPRSLAGLRVLVVEDESLIGMLAEDLLEQLGCRMVGLISSVPRALEVARSGDLDFALLDVDIGGEPVYPVAACLQARGIPFVFMSGYGGLDRPWQGHAIVQKPFELEQLRREIERAVNGALPA